MATVLGATLLLACGGTPPVSRAPSAADVRALLDEGTASTVAVTARNGAEPALRPWRLPAPRAIVQPTLERVIRSMPRWRVADSGDGVIWAVRRTAVLPFTDDVFLVCSEEGNETVVEVRSAARMGPSDFGRNRRNIVALWTAFQAFMEAHHPPIPKASPDAVS
ncbi:MAG TPA: DUF1499 domain-containing protein [Gemmatimonadales bacterium]|nr:DUF1499 domain-containing protein [Gemmatimonadales bacterium]